MAEQAEAHGAKFTRDPWSGVVTLERCENLPPAVREGLLARWGDLEALIREQIPVSGVALARAGKIVGIDVGERTEGRKTPKRKRPKASV
jgi:hypothetical protein